MTTIELSHFSKFLLRILPAHTVLLFTISIIAARKYALIAIWARYNTLNPISVPTQSVKNIIIVTITIIIIFRCYLSQ